MATTPTPAVSPTPAAAPSSTPAPVQAGTTPPAVPAAPAIAESTIAALKAAGFDLTTGEMELVINGNPERFPPSVVRNFAQKVRAADKKFQEAAARDQRFSKLSEEVVQNPDKIWDAFEMLVPGKADDLALARVEASLRRESERVRETPQQRALREENERLKAAERDRTMKAQQEAHAAEVKAHTLSQGKALFDAVEQTSLPHTDATALRIVAIMERALDQGIQHDATTLARLAEQEVRDEVVAILQAQKDPKRRRALIGEDLIQQILRGDVEAVSSAPGVPSEEAEAAPTRTESEDGSTVVRFKPKSKKSKPEAQAIRELTRSLRNGSMPKPV